MRSIKASQLEKKVGGLCLITAPLLFGLSTFFWQNGEYGTVEATLIIFSMFTWIPAVTSLFSLVKNEMPVYATYGLWIAVLGCVSGICFAFLGYLATVFSISHQQFLDSLSRYPVTSQILLFASGPLFPLSILVLGIIFIVKKPIPIWTAILLCLAAILFPLSRIPRIESLAYVADALFLIPCVEVAIPILKNEKVKTLA